jgi:serine/threonine protein phosphatase PrpC
MNIVSAAQTDTGRIRENNEDFFFSDDALGLYAVADGMGGHAGGETASRMAVACLEKAVRAIASQTAEADVWPGRNSTAHAFEEGFTTANRAVYEAGLRDTALRGMGTTLTALLYEGDRMHIGHIGDSRAYRFRNGRLEQLTQDHSIVAEQVRAGVLTPEAARFSPYRHVISRAVGIDLLTRPDMKTVTIESGDICLLTTDGLTEMVTDEEIERVVAGSPFALIPGRLIERANEEGGRDNITVVAVTAREGS